MARQKYVKGLAVVLGSRPHHRDEGALVVSMLTDGYGVVDAIVRGARREGRRWASSFLPLEVGDAVFYTLTERWVLTSFTTRIIPRGQLMNMLPLRAAIGSAVERVSASPHSGGEFEELLNFIGSVWPVPVRLSKFFVELVSEVGYRVFATGLRCARCGVKWEGEEGWFYDPEVGGLMCPQHGSGYMPAPPEAIRWLIKLKNTHWRNSPPRHHKDGAMILLARLKALGILSDAEGSVIIPHLLQDI
jgi:recombinational DNA repair protein (RecF pathway)